MTTWLSRSREALRAQLWPVPALGVVVALLLGFGLTELDASMDGSLPDAVGGRLFGGDAAAARSLLSAIASSLITVTALTFSLTVVTLQLASSQFSPRLLRTFTSDQFVQATLALFLATFTYALTILRAVRSPGDSGDSEFVPRLGVTVAFVLAVASVIGLVLFLAHLTEQLRVETMLRNVHRDGSRTLRAILPGPGDHDQRDDRPAPPSRPPDAALSLPADADGFLTWLDRDGLLEVAVDEDAYLEISAHPGDFVCRGTPLGRAWAEGVSGFDHERAERVTARVAGCAHTHFERTAAQDIGFPLRQLTDVANKALSSGINDPTTAIHALGYISALLCDLSERGFGPDRLHDDDGRVRVVLHRPDFAAYADLGMSQPRRLGAAHPEVLARLFEVLVDLSRRCAPRHRHVVRDQLRRLRTTVAAQAFDAEEQARLAHLGERVEAGLDGPARD